MALMKIRRQGRSLAVTIDAETLRQARLREGDLVQPRVEDGRIVLDPVEVIPGARPEVVAIGRAIVQEDTEVLERLPRYDSG